MPPVVRFVVAITAILLAAAPALAACPASGSEPAQVRDVEAGLELRLADGRLVRLAGLDPAQSTPQTPDRDETSRADVARLVAGRDVMLQLLATSPDRWGRLTALVFAGGAAPEGGLAAMALGAGDGRYLAEPAAAACRDAFLAAEAKARQAKLGLWADPYYAILAVDDHAAFAERSGTNVVAEGRLTAVQTSPYRTTLRFAVPDGGGSGRMSQGGRMLVATILPRTMKAFAAHQIDLQRLVGQPLRLRGLLNLRFGPQLELSGPDALETVTAASGAAAPKPPN